MSNDTSDFYVKSYTFSDDNPHRIEDNPAIILSSCNIHCYTNDAYYGNSLSVPGVLKANATMWFDAKIRPFDLIFKNYNAGNNTTIVITGTIHKK